MKLRVIRYSIFAIVMSCLLGCESEETDCRCDPAPDYITGFSISPRSFSPNDFTEFFVTASENGDIITWAGDWMELGLESGGPHILVELAETYGYTPILLSSFYSADGGPIRPFNDSTRAAYLEGTLEFVDEWHPPYMAFGIEVNILYERYPDTFEAFVDFFPTVYDSVKAHSPNTLVFTTFELEKMKGLHGGLFGGVNDTTNTQWHLLDRFPNLDLIGFSTYPGLIYTEPSLIPENYYASIPNFDGRAYCFTELGWHSSAFPVGWESSEQEQADFVDLFFELNEPHSAEFIVWSFMYDPQTSEPFNAMGLRRSSDGGAKIAWERWISK